MNGNLTDKDVSALKEVFERVTYKLPDAMVKEIQAIFEASRRNCLKCVWWDTPGDMCEKYKQKPPTNVLVSGCSEFDDIPF